MPHPSVSDREAVNAALHVRTGSAALEVGEATRGGLRRWHMHPQPCCDAATRVGTRRAHACTRTHMQLVEHTRTQANNLCTSSAASSTHHLRRAARVCVLQWLRPHPEPHQLLSAQELQQPDVAGDVRRCPAPHWVRLCGWRRQQATAAGRQWQAACELRYSVLACACVKLAAPLRGQHMQQSADQASKPTQASVTSGWPVARPAAPLAAASTPAAAAAAAGAKAHREGLVELVHECIKGTHLLCCCLACAASKVAGRRPKPQQGLRVCGVGGTE